MRPSPFEARDLRPLAPQGDGERLVRCDHFFFPRPGKPGRLPGNPGNFAPRPDRPGAPGKFGGSVGMVGGKPPRLPPAPGKPPGIFLANSAICSGEGAAPPPKPIIWPRPASGLRLPEPMAFIMSAMPRCIFKSLLIASGVVPEPAAMRFLRLALRISGLRRSRGVIESMIAICRLMTVSSILALAS